VGIDFITLCFLLFANRYLVDVLTLNYILLLTGICLVFWFIGTWVMDKFKEKDTKWYYQRWFVFLVLLIFAPLGITLLWAGSKFRIPWKVIFTILFGSWFVYSVLTQSPFYYSPKDKIVELFSTQKADIFLKQASQSVRNNFRDDFLSKKYSTLALDLTVPQIVKKWNESILLVKSIDKNGNVLGQGSGFVINENGIIATNYHVVKSSHSVLIQFVNGKSYQEVSLIAGYPSNDLAILYIEEDESFLPVILGDSDNLQIGEQILAIGNPYGFENTISDGLISGIREIADFKLLQITAPVSPGSSGGALFNMKGEVIGITSIGSQWDAQNLNFAIPINLLKFLVAENLK
jgi:S1-C subfamily serine protease